MAVMSLSPHHAATMGWHEALLKLLSGDEAVDVVVDNAKPHWSQSGSQSTMAMTLSTPTTSFSESDNSPSYETMLANLEEEHPGQSQLHHSFPTLSTVQRRHALCCMHEEEEAQLFDRWASTLDPGLDFMDVMLKGEGSVSQFNAPRPVRQQSIDGFTLSEVLREAKEECHAADHTPHLAQRSISFEGIADNSTVLESDLVGGLEKSRMAPE
jgi:hypothetical protein